MLAKENSAKKLLFTFKASKKNVLGLYVRHKLVSLCGEKLSLCITPLIKILSVQHSLEIGVKEQHLSVYRGCRPKVYE